MTFHTHAGMEERQRTTSYRGDLGGVLLVACRLLGPDEKEVRVRWFALHCLSRAVM